MKKCKDCVFYGFLSVGGLPMDSGGSCRINPPVTTQWASEEQNGGGGWPVVDENEDWCGKMKLKTEE